MISMQVWAPVDADSLWLEASSDRRLSPACQDIGEKILRYTDKNDFLPSSVNPPYCSHSFQGYSY